MDYVNPKDKFCLTPEGLDDLEWQPDRNRQNTPEFSELWNTRHNRPDKISEEEWYGAGLQHIHRVLKMWDKGMSPRIALLAILHKWQTDYHQRKLTQVMIQYVNACEGGDHHTAHVALSNMRICIDVLKEDHDNTLKREEKGSQP